MYSPLPGNIIVPQEDLVLDKEELQREAQQDKEITFQYHSVLTGRQLIMKRILDIVLASIALIVAAPVMIVVAIAIRLDSKGPALFKQQRVGMGGKPFTIYKFRSMVTNAEALQKQVNKVDENGNVIHKTKNDPRVTRMGKIVRKTSLDELPQLLNVIKGDMSLVGPRPELPWLVAEYETWQRQRFSVPQGITGWWQIHDRSDAPLHLNTEQDIYYVENYSLWLDIKIILMTIPALLKQKGAF
jgi:exopolysaccharide biosynthesis polyprenyl glycosylphosphotransferase